MELGVVMMENLRRWSNRIVLEKYLGRGPAKRVAVVGASISYANLYSNNKVLFDNSLYQASSYRVALEQFVLRKLSLLKPTKGKTPASPQIRVSLQPIQKTKMSAGLRVDLPSNRV
ncbi:hypothetical protein LXL04_004958 [Taraxacum kok-saghyz]